MFSIIQIWFDKFYSTGRVLVDTLQQKVRRLYIKDPANQNYTPIKFLSREQVEDRSGKLSKANQDKTKFIIQTREILGDKTKTLGVIQNYQLLKMNF